MQASKELIEYTQDVWEPRLGYRPTEGEAEEMIRNVTNLFKLLIEWDEADKACQTDNDEFKEAKEND